MGATLRPLSTGEGRRAVGVSGMLWLQKVGRRRDLETIRRQRGTTMCRISRLRL
jgi:hypothetical protein